MNSFKKGFFGDILKTINIRKTSNLTVPSKEKNYAKKIPTTTDYVITSSLAEDIESPQYNDCNADDISISSFPEEGLDTTTYTSLGLRKF